MVVSTTAVRQVMAFLVYFILGTCFLLLRCYWLAAAPICGREVARVIYGMARFPTIVWPGSELTAGVSRQKCSWYHIECSLFSDQPGQAAAPPSTQRGRG